MWKRLHQTNSPPDRIGQISFPPCMEATREVLVKPGTSRHFRHSRFTARYPDQQVYYSGYVWKQKGTSLPSGATQAP